MQQKKRNILQDIQPITKHSIRVPRVETPNRSTGVMYSTHRVGSLPLPVSAKRRFRSRVIFVCSIILFVGVFLFCSYFFAKATISITPKQETIDITESVTLVRTGTDDSATVGIPFEVMSLNRKETGEVFGDSTREVSRVAQGTVVFFNKRANPEILVKGTRLTDGSDKIFLLSDTIKIPKAIKSGDQTIPGQIVALVVASEPGARFNIPPADFSIVSYKGTAKSLQVYGRSTTDFSGGVIGTVFVAKESEYAKVFDPLISSIREKLWLQAQAEAPSSYSVFSGATVFEDLSSRSDSIYEGDTAKIVVQAEGALHAVLIERQALLSFLKKVIAKKYSITESDIAAVSIDSLEVDFAEKSLDQKPNLTGDTIPIVLKGKIGFTWQVLPETIETMRKELLSSYTRDFSERIKKFDRIGKAHLVILPFWWPLFPHDVQKIQITVIGQSI